MLLIIEIVLTVAAFKRGWKALAFAPLACVLVLGAAMGLTMGANATQVAPLVDIVGIIVLGVMVAARKSVPQVPPVQTPMMGNSVPPVSVFDQSGQYPAQGQYTSQGQYAPQGQYANPVQYTAPVQVNPITSDTNVPPSPFAQPNRQ